MHFSLVEGAAPSSVDALIGTIPDTGPEERKEEEEEPDDGSDEEEKDHPIKKQKASPTVYTSSLQNKIKKLFLSSNKKCTLK